MNDAETDLPFPPADGETILVVEKEVLIRAVISDYLRRCGYRVLEAIDAGEALLLLEKPGIAIHIVFTDVELSDAMDGFALARWVRENRPDIQVLMAGTARRAADLASDLCESGTPVEKPYDPSTIIDRIKRLLASQQR